MKALKPVAYVRVFSDAVEIIRKGKTQVLNTPTSSRVVSMVVTKLQNKGYLVTSKYLREY